MGDFIAKLMAELTTATLTVFTEIKKAKEDGKITWGERFTILITGVIAFKGVVMLILDFISTSHPDAVAEAETGLKKSLNGG